MSHDKSGRAIWEWAVDTGRHALDSTSRLLKKLELPGLALEEDVKRKQPLANESVFGGPRERDPLAGSGSFNPYNSRQSPSRAPVSKQAARTVARTPVRPAPPPPAPGLFARLFGAKR